MWIRVRERIERMLINHDATKRAIVCKYKYANVDATGTICIYVLTTPCIYVLLSPVLFLLFDGTTTAVAVTAVAVAALPSAFLFTDDAFPLSLGAEINLLGDAAALRSVDDGAARYN